MSEYIRIVCIYEPFNNFFMEGNNVEWSLPIIIMAILMNLPIILLMYWDYTKEKELKELAKKKLSYLLNDVIYLDVSNEEKEMLEFIRRRTEYTKNGQYIRSITKEVIKYSGSSTKIPPKYETDIIVDKYN